MKALGNRAMIGAAQGGDRVTKVIGFQDSRDHDVCSAKALISLDPLNSLGLLD